MFFKSIQLLAYADTIGRSENDVKKAYTALYHSAEGMGLTANEEKTKYMVVKNRRTCNPSASHLNIMNFIFEGVSSFSYFGSLVNENNGIN